MSNNGWSGLRPSPNRPAGGRAYGTFRAGSYAAAPLARCARQPLPTLVIARSALFAGSEGIRAADMMPQAWHRAERREREGASWTSARYARQGPSPLDPTASTIRNFDFCSQTLFSQGPLVRG